MLHCVFFLLFYRHVFHTLLKCSPPPWVHLSLLERHRSRRTQHSQVSDLYYTFFISISLYPIKHVKNVTTLFPVSSQTPAVLTMLQKNIICALSSLSICSSLCLSPSLPHYLVSSQPPSLSSPLTHALCHQSRLQVCVVMLWLFCCCTFHFP